MRVREVRSWRVLRATKRPFRRVPQTAATDEYNDRGHPGHSTYQTSFDRDQKVGNLLTAASYIHIRSPLSLKFQCHQKRGRISTTVGCIITCQFSSDSTTIHGTFIWHLLVLLMEGILQFTLMNLTLIQCSQNMVAGYRSCFELRAAAILSPYCWHLVEFRLYGCDIR